MLLQLSVHVETHTITRTLVNMTILSTIRTRYQRVGRLYVGMAPGTQYKSKFPNLSKKKLS